MTGFPQKIYGIAGFQITVRPPPTSRVDKGRIVQIVNSLPNFAQMSPTIRRFDLEGVPKISRP